MTNFAKWLSVPLRTRFVLDSSPVAVTSPADFPPASSKESIDIQATIECGYTLKRVRDMVRIYSQMNRTDKYSEQRQSFDHLRQMLECSFKNYVVLRSRPVAVTSPSDFAPVSSTNFLDIQETSECRFTLKRVRHMTRAYSQMSRTDKYSEHGSISSPVWPNG